MAKSAVNRLTDIKVKEVSLVDRAANKRQFLVTKRDGSGMSKKLVADGRGGYIEVEKSDAAPAPAAAPAATAPVTAPAETAPAPAPAPAAATAETEKADTIAKMGAVAERLLTVAKAFRDSDTAPPENFADELLSMLEQVPLLKRRMGKGRMDLFEKGLKSFNDLLNELKGDNETETAKGAAAPAAPVIAPASTVTKSARELELEAEIKKSETEIKKLREAPGRPNSEILEETPGGGGEFTWPSDMAAGKRDEQKKKAGLTF